MKTNLHLAPFLAPALSKPAWRWLLVTILLASLLGQPKPVQADTINVPCSTAASLNLGPSRTTAVPPSHWLCWPAAWRLMLATRALSRRLILTSVAQVFRASWAAASTWARMKNKNLACLAVWVHP